MLEMLYCMYAPLSRIKFPDIRRFINKIIIIIILLLIVQTIMLLLVWSPTHYGMGLYGECINTFT